jgi:DNA-binding NtrC family response regulator
VIERIVLLESDDEIRPEHLPSEIVRPAALVAQGAPGSGAASAGASATGAPGGAEVWFTPGVILPLAQVEMRAIQHALACEKGNKTRAAQLLGISRQTLRTKLKEHALADDAEEAAE